MYGFYMNIGGNMKKYMLLFALGLALVATRPANAQKQPYNIIVVEEFTGTWCVDCPAATDTLAALLKDYPQIEVIGYHLQGASLQPPIQFLYNMDTWMRSGYYDTIRSIPTAFINGSTALKNSLAVRMQLRKAIEEKLNDQTFYTMTLEAKHFPLREAYRDSFEIKVKIARAAPDTVERQLRLQLAFTQDHFPFTWRSQTEVNHANTFMYPDGNGTAVTLDDEGKAEFSFAFSKSRISTKWPASNGHLVAFLQDTRVIGRQQVAIGRERDVKDNTILQAARADFSTGELSFGTEDIKTPDFWATPLELDGNGTVRFYDNTFGQTSSWNWEFEGIEPDTSSLRNPVVYYAEPGLYDVRLTTVSEDTSRSLLREGFVRVLDTKPRIGITPNPARPNQPIKLELLSLADSCEWLLMGSGSSSPFFTGKSVETTYPREGSFNINLKTYYKSPVSGISYTHDTTAIGAVVISMSADNETFSDNSIRIVKSGDSFEVQTDRAVEQVEVYAPSGRCVLATRQLRFSLTDQAAGMYIVSVKPADGTLMIFKVLR